MSVINRIEVANLLNKHGDIASPWDAKMRHLLLDLRGQSSAISMENGFGKTTLAEALIGLLSRDPTLLKRARRKCSPANVAGQARSWSHLRVEFRSQSGALGQSDMLAAAGEEVAGETFVFGMYGYCDGSGLSYYHYAGTFSDVPVHHVTSDGKLALYANSDVQAAMRQHGVTRSANREEWLDAVGAHISRRELAQMAAFQKEGGADKSQIFNAIKPRAGEKADQAFFFEVLAPQILSGATRGETDEGEELIEDVILNSGTKVTELRYRLNEAEQDQQRAEDKVTRLDELNTQGEALLESRATLAELDEGLVASECLLGGQALSGLPGLPRRPSLEVSDAELIGGLAWGAGDTERPRVSTWLLAKLTNQTERNIRQAISERGARVDSHRRLIHLPEARWPAAKEMHHVAFSIARDWLADSQAFDDDSARYRAMSRFDEAADSFEALDGNRFREEVIADREYLKELKSDAQHFDTQWEQLDREREQLESRQREFTDNQSFYTQALSQGLFSEAELETPEATQQAASDAAQQARQALANHISRAGELKQPAQWYEAFKAANPETSPGELLSLKSEQQAAIEEQHENLKAELDSVEQQRQDNRVELERLRGERQHLQGEQGPLRQGREAWQAFSEGWPDEQIEEFWSRHKAQLAALQQECRQQQQRQTEAGARRAHLMPLAEAAQRYSALHGHDDPVHLRDRLYRQFRQLDDQAHHLAQQEQRLRELHQAGLAFAEISQQAPQAWLRDAKPRYRQLLGEAERLEELIASRERYLESLNGDPLARQAAESEAQRILDEAGIAYVALHEMLTAIADEDRRREGLIQAAGQLFAPVIEGRGNARQAAEMFIERGLGVPVIEAQRLALCLENGQAPLGAIQGTETLAVKAALDPQYLTALREETQQRLAADRQRFSALEQEIALLDPHGDTFILALRAQAADEEQAEAALESLSRQQDALNSQREQLAPRMTDEALTIIDDFQRYLQEGGDRALEEAAEILADSRTQLAKLTPKTAQAEQELADHGATWLAAEKFADAGGVGRLQTLEKRLAELAEQEALAEERFVESEERFELLRHRRDELDAQLRALFADGERDRLRVLEAFEAEGGVAFMRSAGEVENTLNEAVAIANRRADFDFARICSYLEVRDERGGTQKLEREIARLKRERDETHAARKANGKEQQDVEARLELNQQAMMLTDQLAIAWLELLRELPSGWQQRLTTFDDFSSASHWPSDHPQAESLNEALFDWRYLAGAQENEGAVSAEPDFAQLQSCQQTLLDALGSLNLGERSRNRERQAKEVDSREKQLTKALDEASNSRLFNDTERARLATLDGVSPEALDNLRGLYTQLNVQLGDHHERVAKLHASREHIEGNLVERLGSIIADAAGNLDILRRVAKRSGDGGAFFEVKAALIDDSAVRELIQLLLGDIDEHQAAQRRRLTQEGANGNDQRRRDEELTQQIRRRIYRGLFRDVSIRLKHEAIRPHGRLFSLNEDMSEGQREAVSLMWLVKLSEFAIERELRELPGNHKRRARAGRESVILLDGLFSKLSHRRLIQDSLESLRNTRGRFQMIGLIHNPNYENDAAIFPTYLVGSVIGGQQGQGGHVVVRDGQVVAPEASGRGDGEASLFGIHITEPAT